MKKEILALLVFMAALSGCYSDKGNYDYANLDPVKIELSETTFNRSVGAALSVQPTITTNIAESDLTYEWQVFASSTVSGEYASYKTFQTGKQLDYKCMLTTLMPTPGSYTLRLKVSQNSTNRTFYSDDMTLSILGVTGLLVLHGDDTSSDIGVISAKVFAPGESDTEAFTKADFYSSANGGTKLQGKGLQIIQSYPSTGSKSYPDRCFVMARTDKECVLANYGGLVKQGVWDDLFYGGLNQHKPEGYCLDELANGYVIAFDGGDMFYRWQNSSAVWVAPSVGKGTNYTQYSFAPYFMNGTSQSGIQAYAFDRNSRGFIAFTSVYSLTGTSKDKRIYPIEGTSTPFNPAHMNADLLFIGSGGTLNHDLAVMRNDDGTMFLAELNPYQKKYSDVAVAKYDMSGMSDVSNAKFFAFGSKLVSSVVQSYINMCYYATSNSVYRYTCGQTTSNVLTMTDGTPCTFDGEITMMKTIAYNSKIVMLVGTYSGGTGTLYRCVLDELTGLVSEVSSYTGFGKIYDANIKAL